MKRNRITDFIMATFTFAALATTGCAEKQKTAEAPSSPAKEQSATARAVKAESSSTANLAIAARPDVTTTGWTDIKDSTYDSRASFFAGVARMEATVDDQFRQLTTKRAAMTSSTDTKEWDFSMKEMTDARSYLKSVGDEARKATVETWEQQKEKVGQAWLRTQAAFNKVNSSTNS